MSSNYAISNRQHYGSGSSIIDYKCNEKELFNPLKNKLAETKHQFERAKQKQQERKVQLAALENDTVHLKVQVQKERLALEELEKKHQQLDVTIQPMQATVDGEAEKDLCATMEVSDAEEKHEWTCQQYTWLLRHISELIKVS